RREREGINSPLSRAGSRTRLDSAPAGPGVCLREGPPLPDPLLQGGEGKISAEFIGSCRAAPRLLMDCGSFASPLTGGALAQDNFCCEAYLRLGHDAQVGFG